MFRIKEKQSLLEARTNALKRAEQEIMGMRKENLALYKENKDLMNDNEEQKELIGRIINLVSGNKYNNEKVILNKIKELISDSESQN
ncbi:MAG: hypothetical protein HFJ59_00355 [Clostridia bacterium]|nr:hypothetical protein [Clostridia bacterium]